MSPSQTSSLFNPS